MPSYTVAKENITAGGDPQTLINIFSVAGASRGKVYNIILGSNNAPDDQSNSFEVKRTTAVGTEAGGITPEKHDPNTAASSFDAGWGHTVEPTETGTPLAIIALNKRATISWLANPGNELIMPATTNNGLNVVRRTGTAAYVIDCTVMFEE
jgi:hypothetical protein